VSPVVDGAGLGGGASGWALVVAGFASASVVAADGSQYMVLRWSRRMKRSTYTSLGLTSLLLRVLLTTWLVMAALCNAGNETVMRVKEQ